MKHKSMKQIKEELREVNSDFHNGIKEINANAKKDREKIKEDHSKRMQKNQADWDKMSDKKVKNFNIFLRTVGVLSLIVGFICIFVDPLSIVLIIGGVFFVRFDANKRKSEYKEKRRGK